ncbi:MAG: hypothetical protein ACUVWN_08515 [bacterium]
MAINTKKLGFTLLQILAGGCAGLLAGLILLSLINLIWSGLSNIYINGFIKALLILISFLILVIGALSATVESILLLGRYIPREISRKKIYEGGFLGICTAVAFLTVTRGDWMGTLVEWGGPIRLIGTIFYFVVALPAKLFTFWIPVFLLIFLGAPIGSAIAYNLMPQKNKNLQIRNQEGER